MFRVVASSPSNTKQYQQLQNKIRLIVLTGKLYDETNKFDRTKVWQV